MKASNTKIQHEKDEILNQVDLINNNLVNIILRSKRDNEVLRNSKDLGYILSNTKLSDSDKNILLKEVRSLLNRINQIDDDELDKIMTPYFILRSTGNLMLKKWMLYLISSLEKLYSF